MKTLIIYASKHGSAEKAANKLYQHLGDEKEIVNIQENSKPFLENFDTVIIGGSIYGGKIQKEIQKFIEDNLETLLSKRIGLYLCCGIEKDFEKQLENSMPEKLLGHTSVVGYFGYEYNIDKMNFLEKTMVKFVAKDKAGKSNINEENIKEFAREIKGE
ncbi:MAG TPA: flavodoxin domain-containing protein [Halanaerobiales bacterium]|nr:flavodoxin domain-containing protein [Halanaerobiales bacterium]